jgi:hypothetical protein
MTKKTGPGSDALIADMQDFAQRRKAKNRVAAFDKIRATSLLTDRIQGYGMKPLKDNELKSVYALFAWVANEQGASEQTVQMMTEAHFGVQDVTSLPQRSYDDVIKFLVDLRIDEMRH